MLTSPGSVFKEANLSIFISHNIFSVQPIDITIAKLNVVLDVRPGDVNVNLVNYF